MVPLFQRISLSPLKKRRENWIETFFCGREDFTFSTLTVWISKTIQQRTKTFFFIWQTYGSVDLGIMVPSSFMRSLMLNLRLLSTVDKQEWQAKKTKKHWVFQMAFESLRRPNNNASNKSDRGDNLDLNWLQFSPTYWGCGCPSSAFLSVKL